MYVCLLSSLSLFISLSLSISLSLHLSLSVCYPSLFLSYIFSSQALEEISASMIIEDFCVNSCVKLTDAGLCLFARETPSLRRLQVQSLTLALLFSDNLFSYNLFFSIITAAIITSSIITSSLLFSDNQVYNPLRVVAIVQWVTIAPLAPPPSTSRTAVRETILPSSMYRLRALTRANGCRFASHVLSCWLLLLTYTTNNFFRACFHSDF